MINVPEEVKAALRAGNLKKQYIFKATSPDLLTEYTLDNTDLIYESVKIDERMCSGSELRLGLCEASSLEFQYFGLPDLTGYEIECSISVQYEKDGALKWYTIPMGFYTVDKCSRQAATGNYKAVCYNKLKSSYLDVKANEVVKALIADNDTAKIPTNLRCVINELLGGTFVSDERKMIAEGGSINDYELVEAAQKFMLFYKDSKTNKLVTCAATPNVGGCLYLVDMVDELRGFNGYLRLRINKMGIIRDVINTFPKPAIGGNYVDKLMCYAVPYAQYKKNPKKYKKNYMKQPPLKDFLRSGAGMSINFGGKAYSLDKLGNNFVTGWNYYDAEALTGEGSEGTMTGYYIDYHLNVPVMWTYYENGKMKTPKFDQGWSSTLDKQYEKIIKNNVVIEYFPIGDLIVDNKKITAAEAEKLPEFTLRDVLKGYFETQGTFGRLDRSSNLLTGRSPRISGLYPRNDLYPMDKYPASENNSGNDFTPSGDDNELVLSSAYSKMWVDRAEPLCYRDLIVTYKSKDGDQAIAIELNAEGNLDYDMSDNFILRSFEWTESEVLDMIAPLINRLKGFYWTPFEADLVGLPYLETGDGIVIDTGGKAYPTFIAQRQLSGIHNLKDTYANGEVDVF